MNREEIARVYPPEAFAEDRNRNARTESEIQYGLVLSSDEARRLAHQAGEVGDGAETAFLAPFPEESYDGFLDRALSRAAKLETPRSDDKVLQGLRQ
jgi:hypothetical protein